MLLLVVVAVAMLFPPARLDAQDASHERETACSVVLLPPEHWAIDAARRIEAEGAAPSWGSSRTPTVCQARRFFLQGAEAFPEASDLADRLEREFPSERDDWPHLAQARLDAAALSSRDVAAPGLGEFEPERTGALYVPDATTLGAAVEVSVQLVERLAVSARAQRLPRRDHLDRLEITGRLGGMVGTLGRGAAGYGYSPRGSIVLHRIDSFDRILVQTESPFRLPSVLRIIGPIGISGFVGRLDEDRHAKEPYFWGGALSVTPHPRFTVAVHRGAMFGGAGVDVSTADLLNMLIGRVAGVGFENQVVSVQGTWRLPTETILPATLYLDWGAEDAAGAWTHVPGQVFGIHLPHIPMLDGTAVSLEFTRFAPSCCFNPEWYRHSSFPGSWASGDAPLGHPLGGHGREFALILDRYDDAARLHSQVDLFARDRFAENLYVPGRAGRSYGTTVDLSYDATEWLRGTTRLNLESGDGWTERRFEAVFSLFP